MVTALGNPEFLFTVSSGILAFLFTFAAVIWKISQAEANISKRIEEVEHDYELELERIRKEMLEIQLSFSREYLKKDAFLVFTDRLETRLIRLEGKLDTALTKE